MLETILLLSANFPASLRVPLRKLAWHYCWKKEYREQPVELQGEFPKFVSSERVLLTETIGNFYPFASVLEVGCSYGQNFHLLAKIFPKISLLGIDIDRERVLAGQKLLEEAGFTNAFLRVGDARKLDSFDPKSFDVVIASASLLSITPQDIISVLQGMVRIARKGVVLLEQHRESAARQGSSVQTPGNDLACNEKSLSGSTYWIRDYRKILETIVPKESIRITKVSSPLWVSEHWQEFGSVIEVDLLGTGII